VPSPVYQNVVNLIVGVPIWRHLIIVMDVAMWEHCTFDNEEIGCGKITTLPPLSLQMSCERSLLIVR
jgi:hypothetical protein